MKHMICTKHLDVIFTIASTKDELRTNQYDYGMTLINSHLIEHDGEACKLIPVNFQKAKYYDGS